MAIPSLPLQNPCDTVTFLTTGTLASKQYNFVYQSDVNHVKISAVAQNEPGMNVFILQNTPGAGEEADCGVLGTGDSFLAIATGAVTIGANLAASTGGAGKLSTAGGMFYAKAKDVSTAAGDIIVVATLTGQST